MHAPQGSNGKQGASRRAVSTVQYGVWARGPSGASRSKSRECRLVFYFACNVLIRRLYPSARASSVPIPVRGIFESTFIKFRIAKTLALQHSPLALAHAAIKCPFNPSQIRTSAQSFREWLHSLKLLYCAWRATLLQLDFSSWLSEPKRFRHLLMAMGLHTASCAPHRGANLRQN